MSEQRRAVVISNCQCLPIASWLTTLMSDVTFDFWGVHILPPDRRGALIEEFVTKAKADYSLILTVPLSEEFGFLSTANIAGTFAGHRVITISNIYFSGLHPDLTYVGGLSQRLTGPLVDYHSKLAIYGFLKGYSVQETQALFCDTVFQKMGYYEEFANSLSELRHREQAIELPIASLIESTARNSLCFFSVNHPSSGILAPYCAMIADYLQSNGLGQRSGMPADPSVCAETLAANVIFPIYPEIASYHGVPQIGSYAFKPVGSRVNAIDLPAFIAAEFSSFRQVGAEALANTHAGTQIAAKFRFIDS